MSKLVLVPTPIGNLGDITLRALEVLKTAHIILAEDTRVSKKLLNHYEITTPLRSYHMHNEHKIVTEIVQQIKGGFLTALVSDAGTPAISDPGYRVVKRAQELGIEVVPIPGASAMLAALSVSGLPTDHFQFEGFLSAKTVARQTKLKDLQREGCTLVFYEAPHRIKEMLQDASAVLGPNRMATVAREMTKKFEQICYGSLDTLVAKVESGEIVSKGEFVVVIEGNHDPRGDYEEETLMAVLLQELPPRKAASLAHQLTGAGKNISIRWPLT